MGVGKNPRGGKRSSSSSSFSTVSVIVFVAFCLVGLCMYSSSSVVPLQKLSASSSASHRSSTRIKSARRDSVKDQVFEDNTGDLPDDLTKRVEDKISNNENKNENYDITRDDRLSESGTHDKGRFESEEDAGNVDKSSPLKDDDGDIKRETSNEIENAQEEIELKKVEDSDKEKSQSADGDESAKGNSNDAVGTENEQSHPVEDEPHREEIEIKNEDHHFNGNLQQNEDSGTNVIHENEEKVELQLDEKANGVPIAEDQEKVRVDDQQSTDISIAGTDEQNGNFEADKKPERTEEETNHSGESFPDGMQTEILNETKVQEGVWATQADQSENEKERQNTHSSDKDDSADSVKSRTNGDEGTSVTYEYTWELCNSSAGPDYIPCLDNEAFLKTLHSRGHYEHRERHCPEESITCLVPLPSGYRHSIPWPTSRDKIWYNNVPHTQLAVAKGHQNWVKVSGEHLTFPGGGTQFIHGALHYIDFVQKSVPRIAWGKRTRVVLDVGCGVASFGGYLFERDVLTMSFAPKDEHEAQVQFALERGIPAISAVMGTKRLPFPGMVFDLVHCARCRVPWHADGGNLLLELNRVLRPGGFFVWSATPVYQKLKEDVEIWKAMTSLTMSMCWDLVSIKKDKLNSVGAAIYRKPTSNECYDGRKQNSPVLCDEKDDRNAAWYVPLRPCMHRAPTNLAERGSEWPKEWPQRLHTAPYWLNNSQTGVYGKPAPEDFRVDYEHWKNVVKKSYIDGMGIDWSNIRNVMDMRAVYGGFAAALRDLKLWVMNVVTIDSPDTLPIIYERGLFGIYHDWCESFSTYPRTYDLLHADHLFSRLKNRCDVVAAMAEVDRILRPGGKFIMRDESSTVKQMESVIKSLHWEIRFTFFKDEERILYAEKSNWRPLKLSSDS